MTDLITTALQVLLDMAAAGSELAARIKAAQQSNHPHAWEPLAADASSFADEVGSELDSLQAAANDAGHVRMFGGFDAVNPYEVVSAAWNMVGEIAAIPPKTAATGRCLKFLDAFTSACAELPAWSQRWADRLREEAATPTTGAF